MESRIYNNELGLKINLYQSIIIYTKNCTLTIKDLRKKITLSSMKVSLFSWKET